MYAEMNQERELENKEMCPHCEGNGGWDRSTDCETYDDWVDCQLCDGKGYL